MRLFCSPLSLSTSHYIMTTTVRLIVKDGHLYFPFGGVDANFCRSREVPSMLFRSYPAGDVDLIPWPFKKPDHAHRLAAALYDERECNDYFPVNAVIELPDGVPFHFDNVIL